MARVLVAYHTVEGQAAKVAERIAEVLRDSGAEVEVRALEDAPPPAGFDAVVVGDSIHAHHHSRELSRYVERHVEALNGMPTALFQVSHTSAGTDDAHEQAARAMVRELLDERGFDPKIASGCSPAPSSTRGTAGSSGRSCGRSPPGRAATPTRRATPSTPSGRPSTPSRATSAP